MNLIPVGIINSPYKNRENAPRQGRYREDLSTITIYEQYLEALQSIERNKFYHVLYWLDKAERDKLKAVPPGKTEERGIFSIRSPVRPNPIALCLVELVKIEGNILTVKWLDALDGSILLDIKPFWPEIDCVKI